MSLRHALLGLVAYHPASGYDLMAIFRTSLAHVWPATQSQVYGELARLTDAELLAVTAQGPRGRKEFTITEAGRSELVRWVTDASVNGPHRNELLLHVFFLGVVDAGEARQYLARQAELATDRLELLRRLESSRSWDNEALGSYGRLALEHGLRLAAMERDWAEWAASQIGSAPTSSNGSSTTGPSGR
ncbi:MAG: PadR family transcriptional regulator [Actinobacteria bacterium]|nr:PadR family transcriptional regulator [Actinomycetota bacterium]MBI3686594.1 PadR family transcriptional regulator [Actinomycetota bacterium]